MPQETPSNDRADAREAFAKRLSAHRERHGVTVREAAAAADVPVATVGGYLSGRHLPPLAAMDQFRRVLEALGVPESEHDELVAEAHRIRRIPGPRPTDSPSPYRGLAVYEVDDAGVFVGREGFTQLLMDRVLSHPTHPIVLIGPSGSGKSSVLRAGLVAALRVQGLTAVLLTPNGDLGKIREASPGDVVVVDQLEESLGEESNQALQVISELREAHDRGVTAVVALRSDFFDQALALDPFAVWVSDSPVILAPLTMVEMRRIVLEPARTVGIDVEPALVDIVVTEACGSDGELDPGALPLISHALYATWTAAPGHRLTLAHYQETGGVRGSVTKTAENMYEGLSAEQQAMVRRVLLRLVHVREGAPDTRRPADRREFVSDIANEVLDACITYRLITSDMGRVQLAHEVLISAWPRLRRWLDENRDALRVRSRLTEAVGHWVAADRDPDLLYRGTALAGVDLVDNQEFTVAEAQFVVASRAAERSQTDHQRRTATRLRILVGALAAATLAAGGTATAAWQQKTVLGYERDLAVSRQLAVTSRYLAETDPGLAAQVAVAANDAADTVEGRSALLSASGMAPVTRLAEVDGFVNSLSLGPSDSWFAVGTEASKVELWSGARFAHHVMLPVGEAPIYSTAISPDGSLLFAGGGDGELLAWDTTDPTAPVGVEVPSPDIGATIYGVAIDPTGTKVAAAASDGSVHLWQVDGSGLTALGSVQVFSGTVQSVVFIKDVLAAGGSEGMLAVIELDQLTVVGSGTAVADGQITDLDLSPDGSTLAVSSYDFAVHLWDVTNPVVPTEGATLAGPTSWVNGVAFSPDGSTLAAASSDKNLWTWDLLSGTATRSLPDPAVLIGLAWTSDGSHVFVGGMDNSVRAWDFPGPGMVGLTSVPSQIPIKNGLMVTSTRDGMRMWDVSNPDTPRLLSVNPIPEGDRLDGTVDYSPELGWVVAGTRGGSGVVWDVSDPAEPVLLGTLTAHTTWIELVDIDASGTRLAMASDDGGISLWDLSEGFPTEPSAVIEAGGMAYGAVFNPEGTVLAAAVLTASEVHLYDVSDLSDPTLIGKLPGPDEYVYTIAFSPDGTQVAAGSGDGALWLWDVTDPTHPNPTGGPLIWGEGSSRSLTYSPDGTHIAEAMTDGSVRLWDLSDPEHPSQEASLEGITGTAYGVGYWDDGSRIVAAGSDKTIRVFSTSVVDAAVAVCGAATRGSVMNPTEWGRIAADLPFPKTCS